MGYAIVLEEKSTGKNATLPLHLYSMTPVIMPKVYGVLLYNIKEIIGWADFSYLQSFISSTSVA